LFHSSQAPLRRPQNAYFSSGPCAKRPGWTPAALNDAAVGRSKAGRAKLKEVIDLMRTVLGIPDDYRVAIVPGSDTGAVEMALWSLLGPRGVDVLAWESFGKEWVADITRQLRLPDVRVLQAHYGALPDLREVDPARDVVFTCNGTTSGVRVPDGEWISTDRKGSIICDATSAAFAMDLPWDKLDVVTWSWQKVLGGGGAHGVLVLSPRAVVRLESYTPPWPLPKLFRLTKGGKLNEGLFQGETINTPSMLAVEDAIDGLRWAQSIGGLPELIRRSEVNLETAAEWQRGWADFLASDPATRSCTSICLRVIHSSEYHGPRPRGSGATHPRDRDSHGERRCRLRHRIVPRCTAWPAPVGRSDSRKRRHGSGSLVARLGLRPSDG